MEPVIQVRNLKKRYGKLKAVDGISLSVEKGEIFGLLGHNGAGKSTAVECMTGTRQPDSGEAAILSLNPQKGPQAPVSAGRRTVSGNRLSGPAEG